MPRESPEKIIRAMGRRVAELRRARGVTQADLAERLGVTIAYTARIEQGRQNVTLRTLVHLAQALGVSTRELLDDPVTLAVTRGRPPRAS